MKNKAYIVANEQQEREVLKKLEEKGALWQNGEKAVNFIPFRTFPYVIYCNGDKFISWDKLYDLDVNKIIVFDGRNEEHMSDKYVVSQEFMDALVEWKDKYHLQPHVSFDSQYVSWQDLESIPMDIKKWWHQRGINDVEINTRLISIIRWLNGEDVFKVEKPKKWVVRSKSLSNSGNYWYVLAREHDMTDWALNEDGATKFDTKEEAESWANSHQEVIEVEE